MALKRYTTEELVEVFTDLFYDHLSSSENFYTCGESRSCTAEFPTVMDMLYSEHLDTIKENEERIQMYQEAIAEQTDNESCKATLLKQLSFLLDEKEIFASTNMEEQKRRYKKTGKIDYTKSAIRIPLDKKINSFYDDLILEVLFYDDIGVLNGKHDIYASLETKEERLNFIKANTEITHMGLVYIRNNSHIATIGVTGKLNLDDPRIKECSITLLEHKFSDFENLTLSDTMSIDNNDLRQFIQTKLDLDKANMELLANKDVRGDNYRIYRNPNPRERTRNIWDTTPNEELYIRYVCPSTGRVYYNQLSLRNLELSEYYKEDNYESYIDSWWSINNLGAAVEGKAIIRC